MKKTILFSILTLYSIIIYSQTPAIQWQKPIGGFGNEITYSIFQTSDGGYISAGFSDNNSGDVSGNHGSQDIWIVKSNNLGAIQWQKCLGGSNIERGYQIIQTLDGGYILAGTSYSIDGDATFCWGGGVYSDYWIVKLSNTGSIQWQKSIGGTQNDEARSIEQTIDGGYIINGISLSADGDVTGHHGSTSDPDIWVVKISSTGAIEWQKSLGGNSKDEGYSIKQTIDGGYVVFGFTESTTGDVIGNHGGRDYWLVKLNNLGAIQWQKCYGGSANDSGVSIQKTNDNGFVLLGSSASYDGDATVTHLSLDYWIVKVDSIGSIQWQKSYGGTNVENAFSIYQTEVDNGYIIGGNSSSNDGDVSGNHGGIDCWIIRLDSVGGLKWEKSLGGSLNDWAYSIQQTVPDGGFIIGGSSFSDDGDVVGDPGYLDCWIIKIDAFSATTSQTSPSCKGGYNGVASVTPSFGIPPYSYLWSPTGGIDSIEIALSQGIYTCAITDSIGHSINKTVTILDPIPFTIQPSNEVVYINNNTQFFVGASEPTSTFQWQEDSGSGFVNLTNAGLYFGVTNDTLSINNIPLTMNNYNYRCLVSNSFGCQDTTLVAQLSVINVAGINQNFISPQIEIMPNPSSGIFYFKNLINNKIEIYDIAGRLISNSTSKNETQIIDLSEEEKGLYFYRITSKEGEVRQGKIIVK